MREDTQNWRRWISSLSITLTTIIAYLAFWHLAPGTTFLIGVSALILTILLGWVLGKSPS